MTAWRRWAWLGGLAAVVAALGAPPAQGSVDSTVAAGPNGGAQFVWSPPGSPRTLQARSRSGSGALSERELLSPVGEAAEEHSLGTDAAGNAVIAWVGGDRVRARRRSPDGTLSPLQVLSPAGVGAYNPTVAVEPDGDAVVVWTRSLSGRRVVQARRRAATGALGPIHTLSYAGADSEEPDVAVSPGGAATVAWRRRAGDDARYLQTRTIAADESLSAPQQLTPSSGEAYNARVTVNDAGTAVFAWTRSASGGTGIAETRARSAAGALTPTTRLSAEGTSASYVVTVGDATGRTAYVWERRIGASDYALVGRVRQPGGALGPIFSLDAPNGIETALAMDPGGNLTVAWRTDELTSVVRSRRRSVTGTLGPIRTLSDTSKDAGRLFAAVDGAGKATIAWHVASTSELVARTVTAGGTVSPIQSISGG